MATSIAMKRKNFPLMTEEQKGNFLLKEAYELYCDWSRSGFFAPEPKYKTLGFVGWSYDEFCHHMRHLIPFAIEKDCCIPFRDHIDDLVPEREEKWRKGETW